MSEQNVPYWHKTANTDQYPPLSEDIETDVLIIGGGITGITCAYCLGAKAKGSVLIEAGGLCDGTTGSTTGKVTVQHGVLYSKLDRTYGIETARRYYESMKEALDFVRAKVELHSIDCSLAVNTAYLYAETQDDLTALEQEYDAAGRIGIYAHFAPESSFPPGCLGILGFRDQLVFHSVRYVNALAKLASENGAKIHCETKAVELTDGDIKTVRCESGITIRAKHVVMATQYPFYDGPNLFFSRLYASRDYGIAVETQRDWPDGSYVNVGTPTRSLRTHVEEGKRILIAVGEDHFPGRSELPAEKHYDNLLRFADEVAGVKQELARWSAQDYETPDHIPYIGRVGDGSTIYVAAGYKKWGLSTGTLAGSLIADLILKGNSTYEDLYSRTRRDITSSFGTVLSENAAAVGELIKSKFEGNDTAADLLPGEGRVILYGGQKAGIYRDIDDTVTILDISCTHMTTEVNFNSAEKTWDCPAHGGRYNTDGDLLEGPPKHNLQVLFRGRYSDLVKEEEDG